MERYVEIAHFSKTGYTHQEAFDTAHGCSTAEEWARAFYDNGGDGLLLPHDTGANIIMRDDAGHVLSEYYIERKEAEA